MPSDVTGAATIAASQSFTAFYTLMPKLSDVRKADASINPDIVGDVRLGEVAAFTLSMGVGAIVSSLTGSPVPAVVSLIVALTMICIYETAMRGDRVLNPPTKVERAS